MNFHQAVWYSSKAITNILSLASLWDQYQVTYDSLDNCFVIHGQEFGTPDILFKLHPSGLHYYNPRGEEFTFVTMVDGNKSAYKKWQFGGAEKAWQVYASLSYPSEADFKWILQSNQIKDCLVNSKFGDHMWHHYKGRQQGKLLIQLYITSFPSQKKFVISTMQWNYPLIFSFWMVSLFWSHLAKTSTSPSWFILLIVNCILFSRRFVVFSSINWSGASKLQQSWLIMSSHLWSLVWMNCQGHHDSIWQVPMSMNHMWNAISILSRSELLHSSFFTIQFNSMENHGLYGLFCCEVPELFPCERWSVNTI